MPTLTSLLARDGVVSLDVIEQALQRQVLEGGELDTALLELGAVKDEDLLARYRADSYDLVPALRAQLDDLESELCDAFPGELARGYQLVPLAKTSNGLVLASAWPLSSDAKQAIADRTAGQIELRIGTELRVLAALERHYGVVLGTRLSRLIEKLGGPLRLPSTPPAPHTAEHAAEHAGETDAAREIPSGPPVRVMQMVRLGTVRSLPSASVSTNDVVSTRSSRPSMRAAAGRLSGAPRGPLTRVRAMDLLDQADDRDRVLDAFFAFARQYFSCTVLFALRDEHLFGLEASGLPSELARTLEIPVASTGTVHAVVLGRTARIVDLSAAPVDLPLVEALGRGSDQPAALLPIAIRGRIVAVLYGDRSGEPMTINELWELLHTLPAVSAAFERIIKLHKLQAVQARRASGREARAAERQVAAAKPSAQGFARSKINTFSGSGSIRPGSASIAPGPPIAPGPSIAPMPSISAAPRSQSATAKQAEAEPSEAPEPPETPDHPEMPEPQPQAAAEAEVRAAGPSAQEREHETRPSRPSGSAGRRHSMTPSAQEPPARRTLSQPPPGAGSYALASAESAAASAPASVSAPLAGAGSPARDAKRETVPRRSSPPRRSDPRSDAPDGQDGKRSESAEAVNLPESLLESLRTVELAEVSAPIVLNLADEATRLLDELVRVGPDDEKPVVDALLRIGEAALAPLQERFPGPLWFDRHKPRQRMPPGRDLSATARALYAFGDSALPYIAELLSAKAAETRLCATLFAADMVRPELLWPLYQRLFDQDGQVRLVATETLPLYRNVEGFAELLKSLRDRASDEREAVASRLSAIEALFCLRDPNSVELLGTLSGHRNRQLSVPAHRALVAINGNDFGDSDRRWRAWAEKNRGRHRIEWLIDGLMHGDERVRTTAGLELQKLTQVYYGYDAGAGKREREQAQTRYRNWWLIEGRRLFM
ncbi:MAG TPA: hypothetical protein VK509_21315 [Polyangiales bacterium]|nr:hypothetical protein [Polyangiales bacterium]